MQVFADDGVRIDAAVDGPQCEPAVVLLHGFPLTNAVWDAQVDVLATTRCVIRPAVRGTATAVAPDGPYLMERLASDVAALLDALGIGRAALVGHSMGGYIALAFARMFTERVTRLALVASRLRADTPQEAAARQELALRVESEDSVEPVVEAYVPRLFAPESARAQPGAVERVYAMARQRRPAGAAAALRGMALRSSCEDLAEDLDADVLVLAGARDRLIALDEARSDAARFARGRLLLCERSGHLPMVEEPRRVTGALQTFLD